MKQHKLALLALAVTILLWGSSYPAIKMALVNYSPLDLATIRFLFASLSLGLIACLRGLRLPALRDMPFFTSLALTGFVSYQLLLNHGEHTMTAGAAGFMISLTPLFTLLLSTLLAKEKLTLLKVIGTAFAMAGVWLITKNDGEAITPTWGMLMLLLAALSLGLFFILQKRATIRYTSFETTCYAVWIATFIFLIVDTPAAVVRAMTDHHSQALLLSAYLGLFCTSIAYWLWAYTLSKLEVSKASMGTYLVPFISAWIAASWLDERYSVNFLMGGVLIVIGLLVVIVLSGKTKVDATPIVEEEVG